jgi:FMN phosphatase YigB (HAD superfamily)
LSLLQVFNKGKVKVEAITFDLDDTLYDNMPVIMNAGDIQMVK